MAQRTRVGVKNPTKKVTKPLGKHSPWVWSVELTRGCNLACWHCTARVFPEDGDVRFMSKTTWEAMCRVIAKVTPGLRLELAQGGEPTLHPQLLEFLSMVKHISPTTQTQVTTNGLTLLKGKVNYADLFAAGANSVYVDMYGQREKHIEMAQATGVEWYKYDKSQTMGTKSHRMANTYYGDPSMRLIILQDNPEYRLRWRKNGRLSTLLNRIDFNASMPYGLVPVREPYERKCTLPMRYVSVDYEGNYLFCCIDFFCESAGLLGNVNDGPGAFKEYWFGRLMQSIRRRLYTGDRKSIPYCSRCNCAFSKCDWVNIWPKGSLDVMWDGKDWKPMPPKELDDEVFAHGWEIAKRVQAGLPTKEIEEQILLQSKKRIIVSTQVIAKKKTACEVR